MNQSLGFGRIAQLITLAAVVIAGPAARAQTSFDYDRYDALDRQVVASDDALRAEVAGTDAWDQAAFSAVGARVALFDYIGETIEDATLDVETVDALTQVRATMAVDITSLLARAGACDEASRWYGLAADEAHPSVAGPLASAAEANESCHRAEAAALAEAEAAALAEDSPHAADLGTAPQDHDRSRRVGRALLGVGGVMVGVALALDAAGASDRKTLDRLGCGEALCVDAGDRQAYAAAYRAEDRRLAPIVALAGAGVVSGVVGAVFVVRGRRGADADGFSLSWSGTGVVAGLRW